MGFITSTMFHSSLKSPSYRCWTPDPDGGFTHQRENSPSNSWRVYFMEKNKQKLGVTSRNIWIPKFFFRMIFLGGNLQIQASEDTYSLATSPSDALPSAGPCRYSATSPAKMGRFIMEKTVVASSKLTVRPCHFSGLEDSFPLNIGDFQGLC